MNRWEQSTKYESLKVFDTQAVPTQIEKMGKKLVLQILYQAFLCGPTISYILMPSLFGFDDATRHNTTKRQLGMLPT